VQNKDRVEYSGPQAGPRVTVRYPFTATVLQGPDRTPVRAAALALPAPAPPPAGLSMALVLVRRSIAQALLTASDLDALRSLRSPIARLGDTRRRSYGR